MSWSGPSVGAAPYPAHPNAQGQTGYNPQQQFQYGQPAGYSQYQGTPSYFQGGPSQRPPESRPPKKKGNPIITRYPPPPGYRGPAQPQTPYGAAHYQNQYQPPQQGYAPGYGGPSNPSTQSYPPPPQHHPQNQGYTPSPHGYGQPPNYHQQPPFSQPSYPQSQAYQNPQAGYQVAQGHQQALPYQGGQNYPHSQNNFQGYPPQAAPANPSQQPFQGSQSWQSNSATAFGQNEHYGKQSGVAPPANQQDPNATSTPTSAHLASSQSTPTTAQPQSATSEQGERPKLYLAWDDWDFDFDGAIWPKSNEPVDPNLSLGVIIWRPAKQVTRALPSTFDDAEEQALKPPAEKLGNGESVSLYFTIENSHEAFLDIRQTDEWHDIKHDPVFVVFPDDKDMQLISLEECIAQRDRPDEPLEESNTGADADMADSTWNVMDNLEQALSGQEEEPTSRSATHVESSRSQRQEDILAMLGVTGSPKPPSNEPLPFPSPPLKESPSSKIPENPPMHTSIQPQHRSEQPQRAQSYGGHRNSSYEPPPPPRPYGSMSSARHPPPPPPPPPLQAHDEHDPGNLGTSRQRFEGKPLAGFEQSPARSDDSSRTLPGSEFDDKNATGVEKGSGAVPKLERSNSSVSRKRSYDESDQNEEGIRQQDDHFKRKRRSQVDAAYGRR